MVEWEILCSLETQREIVGTTSGMPVAKDLVQWHSFAHMCVPDSVSRCGNDHCQSVSQCLLPVWPVLSPLLHKHGVSTAMCAVASSPLFLLHTF